MTVSYFIEVGPRLEPEERAPGLPTPGSDSDTEVAHGLEQRDRDTRVIWRVSASVVIWCAGPFTPNVTNVEDVRSWLSCGMEQSSEMTQ